MAVTCCWRRRRECKGFAVEGKACDVRRRRMDMLEDKEREESVGIEGRRKARTGGRGCDEMESE